MKLACPVCHKDVSLTGDGLYRVHGPRDERCPGSGADPSVPASVLTAPEPTLAELPILGTLERAVQAKPQQPLEIVWMPHGSDTPAPAFTRPDPEPYCSRCDTDTHVCPGCGEPLTHGTEVCAECQVAHEGDSESQSVVPNVPLDIEHPRLVPPTPEITAERVRSAEERRAHADAQVAARRKPVKPAWTGPQELHSLQATVIMGQREAVAAGIDLVRHGKLSCDIETEGLGLAARHLKAVIFSDVPDGRTSVVFDPRDPVQAKMVIWMFDHAVSLAFHNSSFDVPQLAMNRLFTPVHADKVDDTLLWARLAEPAETTSKDLGSCAQRYLGLSYDKKGMAKAGKTVGMNSEKQVYEEMDLDRPIYARGAGSDAIVTARLVHRLQKAALERLLYNHPFTGWGVQGSEAVDLVRREQILNRMSLRRTVKGLRADLEYLDQFNEQHAKRIHAEERKLAGLGIRPGVNQDLVGWLDKQNLVPGDYPVTKTGLWSGAKDHLATLNHPVAADFLWHKEQTHVLKDYLEKVRDLAVSHDGHEWLHPVVKYFGAVTGRQSIGEPPLHQFPEDARGVILADPGDDLTSIDWSQIEPVVISNVAGQLDVLDGYENRGEKFYTVVERLTGIPYKQAKAQLLGTLYGQGKRLTATKLGVSPEEAEEIKNAIFQPMAKVLQMTYTLRELARQHRMVPTISGRILPIPSGFYNGEYSVQTHKGVNFFVQGSAYDILADRTVECEKAGLGDAIYLLMHDEIVCSTDAAHDIRKIMETPPERLCRHSGRTPVLHTDMERLGQRWAKV